MTNEQLADLARKHLGIATLETRNSDRLDFHELSVGQIKAALKAAYEAGQNAPLVQEARNNELIDAAIKLLDARNNHMVTALEWDALQMAVASERTPMIDPTDILDVTHDFQIHKTEPREGAAGTWIIGTVAWHRFEALVFTDNAENREWEIEDSQITKLCIRRMSNKKIVYNWDRGLDVPASDQMVQVIVDFLVEGLKGVISSES